MTKQVLSRALILVSALLVLNGCKSDNANDAKAAGPVLVLDAGAEPREVLRYKIEHGTTTTATLPVRKASRAAASSSNATSSCSSPSRAENSSAAPGPS